MKTCALNILTPTKCLPLLFLLALPTVAQAQYYYTNGADIWSYTPSAGPLTITGYRGSGVALVIPDTIHGFPVTGIGFSAFYNETTLTSIVIPDSVTSISDYAFEYCTSLNSISFGNGVTTLGIFVFAGCTNLPSINIPNSVTSIGDVAFENCTRLTGVTIGNRVTSIGASAFEQCTSLTSVTIPNSVSSLGDDVFAACTSLTSIVIPDSVTRIGDYAFDECTNLTGVTIGNGMTSIGKYAFSDCSKLTGVTMGSGVTSIGEGAFYRCNRLTGVTIPNSVTSLGDVAFSLCTSLKTATIGNGVTSIGASAFYECFGLTNVTIGSSVTSIGAYAFFLCDSLYSITFPGSLSDIEGQAFAYCSFLPNITIPASVASIGHGAFFGCAGLTAINVNAANANYSSVDGILFNKNKDTLIQYPGSKGGDYTIPTSVTSIESKAFYNCSLLTMVTIPNGVTGIGENTFAYCYSLTTATIGSGVTSLDAEAFGSCFNLTGVYFNGNSPTPTNDSTVFDGDTQGVVYYRPWTTGWGNLFDGLPTASYVTTTGVGSVDQIVHDPKYGDVTVTHPDGTTETLKAGDSVQMGDIVKTPAGGMAHILFIDNTSIQVAQNANLAIDEYVYDSNANGGSSKFSILRGVFVYSSGLIGHNNPEAEHLHTGYGYIGIRGTQFIVQQEPCSSTQMVYLIQGELAITPQNTPGATNICDAPVTIAVTATSVTTNALNQATYNSISNQVFQTTCNVTFPSWIEQYFDCTNNPSAAPTADPSGDGENNYSKFLAGMNPTNKASYFHILSTTPQGKNLLVTWLCGGGRTNVLQTSTNFGGSWSNVSPNIVLAGSGDSVTNYLDVGAVTNVPARFYRAQLVQ
jgi:hypothetical protein